MIELKRFILIFCLLFIIGLLFFKFKSSSFENFSNKSNTKKDKKKNKGKKKKKNKKHKKEEFNVDDNFSYNKNTEGPNSRGEIDYNKVQIPYKYFKKNIDAKYMLDRLDDNSEEEIHYDPKLQIAPIPQADLGMNTEFNTTKVKVPSNTTRVPDDNSTQDEIIIPNPSTNPKFKGPEMNMKYKKGYEYTIDDDENNELWFEKESNNYKSTNTVQSDSKKNYLSDQACKFIGSYNSKASCPSGYRNYLGATVGAKSTTLICNDEKIESDKATAVGTINNGKLENIFITNHGSNYKHDPIVKILGDGRNATAQATIKKGKVRSITVTNSGSNYQSTPIIEIEPPNGEVFCHLCCKDFPQ